MAEITDYFAVEDPLIARVRKLLPDLNEVFPAVDALSILERGQVAPAGHVLYSGDQVQGGDEDGCGQIIVQRWTVVLATRHLGDMKSGKGNRELAGPWMLKIAQGLIGWEPLDRGAGFGSFQKTSNALAPFYGKGFAYHPQTFALPVMLIGTGD